MKKMLFSLMAGMMLVGCGGGGSSLPSMDNSKVSGAEETFTGYYAGNGVMFAGENIVGSWTLYQLEPEYKSTGIRFYDDGDLRYNGSTYTYGVSKDGKEVHAAYYTSLNIKYKSIEKNFVELVGTDGKSTYQDCYNVEFQDNYGIYDLIMCP
jgi:hypothetical protein